MKENTTTESSQSKNRVLFDRRSLVLLIVPLLGEQFLNISLGLFDSVMVSSCGEAAVSGVSLVDSVSVLIIQVLSALATGGAVICSQYIGQRHHTHAKRAAGQLMLVLMAGSVSLMILVLFSYRSLLRLIFGSIEADVMESAMTYFWISALSYPFLGLYNAVAALFRSQGNSRISLLASFIMNICNITGNALLIFVFKMGVAGAAIATLLSRVIAALSVFILLQKKNPMLSLTSKTFFTVDKKMIKRILYIGIPSGVENGMFQIGKLMLSSMISGFGTVAITANAVAGNVAGVFNVPGSAMGQAMLTVIGQSIGYGDEEQTRRYGRILHRIAICAVFASEICQILLRHPILNAYNLSPATYRETDRLLLSAAVFAMFFWAESFATPNMLRAAGAANFTMIVSTASMWIFRIGSAIILAKVFNLGVFGVWMGMYIDWIFRSIVFFTVYVRGKWASRKPVAM
ncbi:MAG: MATE family efflux transporter [Lachnospiraceae bacterium]|nr:MATE family efflux transporter [Lachnospiraceae bacterium]